MGQLAKLLNWFQNQLGTAEEPKSSNNIIYNTQYYGRAVSGEAYPWCMVFIWCGFHACGVSNLFYDGKKTASCTTFMKWAKATGQWVTSGYKKGDIVLFDFDNTPSDSEHVGFVFDTLYNKVLCIEGNTNDKVCTVYRDPDCIIGAYRPNYDDSPFVSTKTDISVKPSETSKIKTPVVDTTPPMLRQGDEGRGVMTLQIILLGYGYDVGPDGVDGEFGYYTKKALMAYQKDKGLEQDGVCGPLTYATFWR